jgi:hypothetical protein
VKTCVRSTTRNQSSKQDFTAEFGARHNVQLDSKMKRFFVKLHKDLLDIAGDHITFPCDTSPDGWGETTLPRHTIYNDPRKLAMPVVQMRFSRNFAKDKNIRWNRADLGRLKQGLGDQVAELGFSDEEAVIPYFIPISFNGLADEGIVDKHDGTTKLVLTADPECDGTKLLFREQAVIVDGLKQTFRRTVNGRRDRQSARNDEFAYPTSDYMPRVTVGEIASDVPADKLQRCLQCVQDLMPITATITPLQFIPELK